MTRMLFCLFALAGLGCFQAPRPTFPLQDAQRALSLHASLRREVRTVHAVARVEQRGRAGRIRGTVYALLALPADMRFDVMTQLGPVATLTSDDGAFALLDQREGRFFVGDACEQNVARFLGVALSPDEVVTLLVGGVPADAAATDASIETLRGGYRIRRRGPSGSIVARLEVRRADLELPEAEQHLRLVALDVFDADGARRLSIRYDDYRVVVDPEDEADDQRGVAMPHVVRIDDRRTDSELTVRFTELTLNGEVDAASFTQQAPGGMVVEQLRCDEAR